MEMICKAMVDEFLNVVSGDEIFFDYVGSKFQNSIKKLIPEKELYKIDEAVERLRGGQSDREDIAVNMQNCEGEYNLLHLCIEHLPGEFARRIVGGFHLTVSNISGMEENLLSLNLDVQRCKKLLGLEADIYFEYTVSDCSICFYRFSMGERIVVLEGDFNTAAKEILENGLVNEADIEIFNALCSDIRAIKHNFSYSFRNSIFTDGNDEKFCLMRGATLYRDGSAYSVVGTVSEIDSKSNLRTDFMSFEAYKDSLTSLLNKRAITQYAQNRILTHPNENLFIAIMDIDDFKDVNDNYGHLFGDEVLINFTNIIVNAVRDKGVVGRIGGDEFFIAIDKAKDILEVRSILRSIRSNLEWSYVGKLNEFKVSCSIGCANYPDDARDFPTLFKAADKALYLAKERGKNRYIIYNANIHGRVDDAADDKNIINIRKVKQEINEGDFIAHLGCKLLDKSFESVLEVLESLGNRCALDRISIFLSGDMHRAYVWGDDKVSAKNALYVFNEKYLDIFDNANVCFINNISKLEAALPEAFTIFNEQGIGRICQCLIGNRGDIRGVISFEKYADNNNSAIWSDFDKSVMSAIGSMLAKIISTEGYFQ